jgi:DNA-binding FadR family transcriptional regulator
VRGSTGDHAKLAERVADRMIEDVMALGWPVGAVLGSEAELVERYAVSRAVLREAVRLVEHQQVARTRRGPGGGLVVSEPTIGAVVEAVVLYLHRVDARLDEVVEARLVLEDIATRLAASRADEGDREELRRFAEGKETDLYDPRALHNLVAQASKNAALELFVEVLDETTKLYSSTWKRVGKRITVDTGHVHSLIAESVLAGDAERAARRMRKHLEAEAAYMRRRRTTRQLLPNGAVLGGATNGKLAEAVARRITHALVASDLAPGDLIGSEADLIEREGVSRAVLREAVRLLEHHGVARMRRGPGGGLFAVAPNPYAVTDVAAVYLARQGMRIADVVELRSGVEVALAKMASSRADEAAQQGIMAALDREAEATPAQRSEVVHDLHAAIARAAGNRALELVALVLIRLSRLYQSERLPPSQRKDIEVEIHRAHRGIARAIEAGDSPQSARRLKGHLEALGRAMQGTQPRGG